MPNLSPDHYPPKEKLLSQQGRDLASIFGDVSLIEKLSEIKTPLKVSKSQKQFFLKLHCPKTNEKLDKIYEARAKFCQIFRLYLANEVSRKMLFRFTDLKDDTAN